MGCSNYTPPPPKKKQDFESAIFFNTVNTKSAGDFSWATRIIQDIVSGKIHCL